LTTTTRSMLRGGTMATFLVIPQRQFQVQQKFSPHVQAKFVLLVSFLSICFLPECFISSPIYHVPLNLHVNASVVRSINVASKTARTIAGSTSGQVDGNGNIAKFGVVNSLRNEHQIQSLLFTSNMVRPLDTLFPCHILETENWHKLNLLVFYSA
jgi:hypothetical protein